MISAIAIFIMLGMLAVAIVTDLRTGKVHNILTVPCALAGLMLAAIPGGLSSILDHLLGMAVVLVVWLLVSPLAKLGGGDAKLLMAVGALQGFHFAIWALLLTGVAGGGLALVFAVRQRVVRQTASNLITNAMARTAGISTDLAMGSAVGKIPYSIAIAIGALAALVLQV